MRVNGKKRERAWEKERVYGFCVRIFLHDVIMVVTFLLIERYFPILVLRLNESQTHTFTYIQANPRVPFSAKTKENEFGPWIAFFHLDQHHHCSDIPFFFFYKNEK